MVLESGDATTRVRLADIAQHARVSEATVSRVLNGKPGVAAATREAVLTALDVLGYDRPSKLKRKRTGLVGLIVPELTNPIFPALAQVIETSLASSGYTPVLCTQTPGGVREGEYVRMLLDHSVAGIIFVSGYHADVRNGPQRYVALRERGLPIVLINGYVAGVDAPFISTDDAAAVKLAISHLQSLGHTRIGLAVGPNRYLPTIRKTQAFRDSMAERFGAGGGDDLVEHSVFTVEGGATAATALLQRGATAILCGSDLMALGAVRAIRSSGLRVPEDVSVVGFDDSPLMAFVDPPLTTIRQPIQVMGDAAVNALLTEIAGVPGPHTEFMFEPELVLRGSTAAVRAD